MSVPVPPLSSLVLLPLAGAATILLLPGDRRALLRWVALGIATLSFLQTVAVFWGYRAQPGGFQYLESYEWLPGLGISFTLAVDGISAPLVLLNSIVLITGVLMSWTVEVERRVKDYFVLLLTLVAGVYGTFTALDLFFFFFFYELAVLPMYLLIGVWGSSTDFGTFIRTKEYGSLKLVLYLVAGSVLVWIALIALYWQGGLGTFDWRAYRELALSPHFQDFFYPFFLIGFGILAGLWPFHTWSPDGHVAAPTAVSMLHAGVLMKLGAYGVLRVGIQLLPEGAQSWSPALMVLAVVNILYGAFSAMGQRDLKYVVGYSSVSHMGLVLLGLATLNATGLNGAVFQMFSHGIMTALLFAMVGVIYDRAHLRDIPSFGGLARRMPVTASLFAVAGLSSMALPGTSGFVAELLVVLGTFHVQPIAAVLAVLGAVVTAVYILRLLAAVFFGPPNVRWERLPDLSRTEAIGGAILAAVLIFWGVLPGPLLTVIASSVEPLAAQLGGM